MDTFEKNMLDFKLNAIIRTYTQTYILGCTFSHEIVSYYFLINTVRYSCTPVN